MACHLRPALCHLGTSLLQVMFGGQLMEQPKPTAEHKKLEMLKGKWVGEEMIQGSPHTTETKARGTFDFRMDLGDLFAIVDYVEKSGGKTLMAGHGVIGWDAKKKNYTLH